VSDFVAGTQARKMPVLRVLLVSQGLGLAAVIIALVINGTGPPDLARMAPAVGAGVAGIAALGAFYRALAIGSMSIVAPIAATGVAVPVIVGIAGGDRLAGVQLAGIIAAAVGVALASREHPDRPAAEGRGLTRTSILLALVAALGFGSFFVGLRVTARHDVLWALFGARGAGVIALSLAAVAVRPPGWPERRSLLPLATVACLDLVANVLYAVATRHGLLSEVAVASSLYPVATVLLARVVLGERVRRVQELGILAAIAGVAMIAAG
jgi:drug/metabolite transporter (DMT)-like permease